VPHAPSPGALARDISRLEEMAREWALLFPQAAPQARHWQQVLSQVEAHLAEDLRRVAVVGTVKAGKSTLINTLLGQELLRRGAGILTAMITRVRSGPAPQAVLRFKTWTEVEAEVRRALGLFPDHRLFSLGRPLEVRRAEDRELLAQVLTAAQGEGLWSQGGLNEDYVLLSSILAGYPQVAPLVSDGAELRLEGQELVRHQDLVTREAAAVFLKDVELTVPADGLPAGVELGDCQGSDSPAPQHLAQVLAYLLKTDLALYVVSSRVGLRQGDFQFLAELTRMGMGAHLIFVLNLDLTELRTRADIAALRDRLRQELAPLLPDAPIYTFSSLMELLERRRRRGEALDPREGALLTVWQGEADSAALSREEAERFSREFSRRLETLAAARQAGGSLARVRMVARGLREQAEMARKLLGKDLKAFESLLERLEERRRPLAATGETMKQALAGAASRLKAALKNRVGSFLDPKYGQGALLQEFVKTYAPDWQRLAPPDQAEPLRFILHRLFGRFQEELLRYAGGEVTVRLLEFLRTQEDWLKQELSATTAPLLVSLQDAFDLYYREAAQLGLSAAPPALTLEFPAPPADLEIPLLSLPLDPGWRWTGEAWVRSGVGALRRVWEKLKARLGLKGDDGPRTQLLRDLDGALRAIKEWLREEVRLQLLDYGERVKFRYLFPLVDHFTARLQEDLSNLINTLGADLQGVAEAMAAGEADREARRRRLAALAPAIRELEDRLAATAASALR